VPFETPRHRERLISMVRIGTRYAQTGPLDAGADAGRLDIYRDLHELHRAGRCGVPAIEGAVVAVHPRPVLLCAVLSHRAGVGVAISALRRGVAATQAVALHRGGGL
jgi:hypothetical protein